MNATATILQHIQQGDVILKRIDAVPAGASKSDDRILQHGERTGHKHQFAPSMQVTVFRDASGGTYVEVPEGETALLTHEEHRPLSVTTGVWVLDIVREYDYDREETVRVVD